MSLPDNELYNRKIKEIRRLLPIENLIKSEKELFYNRKIKELSQHLPRLEKMYSNANS